MNSEMCLVICFLVGILLFYLLKQSCGCSAVVEGKDTGPDTGPDIIFRVNRGDDRINHCQGRLPNPYGCDGPSP